MEFTYADKAKQMRTMAEFQRLRGKTPPAAAAGGQCRLARMYDEIAAELEEFAKELDADKSAEVFDVMVKAGEPEAVAFLDGEMGLSPVPDNIPWD